MSGIMKPGPFRRLLEEAEALGIDTVGYRPADGDRLERRIAEARARKAAQAMGPVDHNLERDDSNNEGWGDVVEAEKRTHRAREESVMQDIGGGWGGAKAISTEVSTYVDKAMFEAEPMPVDALEAPKVHLLQATPDPLGGVAAMMMMYEGRVVADLSEITDEERKHYFDQCFLTTLDTPLEAIDFHFLVEGVTRAHTHQEVRQRTAVFAQESMRFAVKHDLLSAVRPGPHIKGDKKLNAKYAALVQNIEETYEFLIANGVPAEEARGVLPHDTLTRLHHKVNLRSLKQELGKRLCTQAQFDWRMWAASLREAIWEYAGPGYIGGEAGDELIRAQWQFRYIAESPIFTPICFQTGKCMFKASMDRGCTIRERVDAGKFDEIKTEEWAADPEAAWVR